MSPRNKGDWLAEEELMNLAESEDDVTTLSACKAAILALETG